MQVSAGSHVHTRRKKLKEDLFVFGRRHQPCAHLDIWIWVGSGLHVGAAGLWLRRRRTMGSPAPPAEGYKTKDQHVVFGK